jgi:hypothetical protein
MIFQLIQTYTYCIVMQARNPGYMQIEVHRSISICCDATFSQGQGHAVSLPHNLRIC